MRFIYTTTYLKIVHQQSYQLGFMGNMHFTMRSGSEQKAINIQWYSLQEQVIKDLKINTG